MRWYLSPALLCCIIHIVQLLYLCNANLDEPSLPIEPLCPLNCSGRGQCDEETLVCSCDKKYTGDGCQYLLTDIPVGHTIEATITGNEITQYFVSNLKQGNTFQVDVELFTPNAKLTLLTKFGDLPLFQSYDYAAFGEVNSSLSLVVKNPKLGHWYMLVTSDINATVYITSTYSLFCPNNCSNNGACIEGICECFLYFSGPDCSFELRPLLNNFPHVSKVDIRQWKYYNVSVPTGNRLDVFLTTSPINASTPIVFQPRVGNANLSIFTDEELGSYDDSQYGGWVTNKYILFAAYGRFPSLGDYDFVANKPYSANPNVSISITQPHLGWWIVGVYGNDTFYFTITVNNCFACPNDCNGNGQCLSNGTCLCNANYYGVDCSLYQYELKPNVDHYDTLPRNNRWKFFNISVDQNAPDLVIHLEIDKSFTINNAMLYLRYQTPPTLTNYDLYTLCASEEQACSLVKLDALSGTWYIGVYVGSSILADEPPFKIRADFLNICPNNCSGNGLCQPSGSCQCNPHWQPPDCSLFLKELRSGDRVYTDVKQGEWRYFYTHVENQNFLQFYMNHTDPNNNDSLAVMYVKYGDMPTSVSYTRTSFAPQNYQQLVFQGAEYVLDGTWYAGVYGARNTTSFWISVETDRVCPRNCSNRGECINGECVCEAPYIPNDCSNQDLPIATNLELSGKVSFDVWNYYHLTVLGDDALEVTVQEINSKVPGVVWLFLKKNGRPTVDDNDYSNQSLSSVHTIFVASTKARGNWTIGVTGSPRSGSGQKENYVSEYRVLALTGCGTYSSCDKCVQDPNCGYCRNFPFDLDSGQCVPGTPTGPLNQTCLYYQYNNCNNYDHNNALAKGLVIGVAVGVIFLLGIGIASFLIYRANKKQQKLNMRPTNFDTTEKVFKSDFAETHSILGSKISSQKAVNASTSSYGSISPPMEGYHSLSSTRDVYTDSDDSGGFSSDSEDDGRIAKDG